MRSLEALTSALEDSLTATWDIDAGLPDEAILSLQRLDFLRQSLGDMHQILTVMGPTMAWLTEAPPFGDLRNTVAMQGSLHGIAEDAAGPEETSGGILF
ncbi:hypothetical protein [Oceanicola sp. 22II-s10i]|uniref:hypothetical protein n=1 Tax=Oceanicola sp. 22II-s10i TaxID=1317116 RepID=UPI00113166A8|nr:hypothetical protein [Oceanicola sp. 22II-s10i]